MTRSLLSSTWYLLLALLAGWSGLSAQEKISLRAEAPVAYEHQRQPGIFVVARTSPTGDLTVILDVGTPDWAKTANGFLLQTPTGTNLPVAVDGTIQVVIPSGSTETRVFVVPHDDNTAELAQIAMIYVHTADQPNYEAVQPGSIQIEIADDDVVLFVDAVDPIAKERGDQWPSIDTAQIFLNWMIRTVNPDGSISYSAYKGPNLSAEVEISGLSTATLETDYFMVSRLGSWKNVTAQSWDETKKQLTLSENGTVTGPLFSIGEYIWIQNDSTPRKITKTEGILITLDATPAGFALDNLKDAPVYWHIPSKSKLSVNLPEGDSSIEFRFVPKDDFIAEGGEFIDLVVSNNTNYMVQSPTIARVVIADNDSFATIQKGSDASEPNIPGSFNIQLIDGNGKPLNAPADLTMVFQVAMAETNGATLGKDYTILGLDSTTRTGSVILPKGQNRTAIFILPLADSEAEPIEYVTIELKESSNYLLTSLDGKSNKAIASIALLNSALSGTPVVPVYFKPSPTPSSALGGAGSSGGCGLGSGLGALVGLAAALAAFLRWRPRRR